MRRGCDFTAAGGAGCDVPVGDCKVLALVDAETGGVGGTTGGVTSCTKLLLFRGVATLAGLLVFDSLLFRRNPFLTAG